MYARNFTLTLLTVSAAFRLAAASTATDPATQAKIAAEYLKLPMTFELNEGQTDPQVKALSRGSRYGLFLTSNESVFVVTPGKKESVVRVRTLGSNPAAKVSGVDPLDSVSNYFVGKDQSKWRKNVANYGRVKYDSIYPGIDLIYYGSQQQLEYDYVVAPGADPSSIRLAIEGARKLRIDRSGDLRLETKYGAIYQHKPVVYQQVDGLRREIAGSFIVRGNQVSFKLGDYDHSRELVIDPSLEFLTYLGGSGTDSGKAITITTATGLTIVAGSTASANFPIAPVPVCPATPVCTTTGVTSYSYTGETDGFLAAFNPVGGKLYNSTYIGGTGGVNVVTSVAIDNFEIPAIIYVAGYTTSTAFDVVNAAQPTSGGGVDAWVSGVLLDLTINFLNLSGTMNTSIAFATYLGGSGTDEITNIAVDQATKDLFVTGFTTSKNFPIVVAAGKPGVVQNTFSGTQDAFVARYASGCNAAMQNIDGCTLESTPAGTLLFSTYLGGTGTTVANGIAVGINPHTSALTAYIVGTTTSTTLGEVEKPSDEPTVTPAVATPSEAFLVSMSQLGVALNFTDFIGSSTTTTVGNAIALDVSGFIYITGDTNDDALTLVDPIFKRYQGGTDVFVGQYFYKTGATMFLSYYGGPGFDEAYGIGVCTITSVSGGDCASAPGAAGTTSTTNLFIAGETALLTGQTTPHFYVTTGAPQTVYGGGASDGFVAMLTSTTASSSAPKWTIGYSSYMGGPGTDIIYGLAVGSSGNARFTGLTNSTTGMATTGLTSGGKYVSGGTGCTNGAQTVTFSGGGATTNATGTIFVSGSVPSGSITLTSGGAGYTSAPTTVQVTTCTGTTTITGDTLVYQRTLGGGYDAFVGEIQTTP